MCGHVCCSRPAGCPSAPAELAALTLVLTGGQEAWGLPQAPPRRMLQARAAAVHRPTKHTGRGHVPEPPSAQLTSPGVAHALGLPDGPWHRLKSHMVRHTGPRVGRHSEKGKRQPGPAQHFLGEQGLRRENKCQPSADRLLAARPWQLAHTHSEGIEAVSGVPDPLRKHAVCPEGTASGWPPSNCSHPGLCSRHCPSHSTTLAPPARLAPRAQGRALLQTTDLLGMVPHPCPFWNQHYEL